MNHKLLYVFFALFASLLLLQPAVMADEKVIDNLIKRADFRGLKISPDGKYVAMISMDNNLQGIQVIDISDPEKLKHVSAYRFSVFTHVDEIMWVGNDRLAFSTKKDFTSRVRFGNFHTWDIYAMDVDGSDRLKLNGAALMIDGLPDDPDHMLVFRNYRGSQEPEIARQNVYNGDYDVLTKSPFEEGRLFLDSQRRVRGASEYDDETRVTRIAYREAASDSEWQVRELDFDKRLVVRGIHTDDQRLVVSTDIAAPFGLYAYDFATNDMEPLLTNTSVEIIRPIYRIHGHDVVGAIFMEGHPGTEFIDPNSQIASLHALLSKAFPSRVVSIASMTRSGDQYIVKVSSDTEPADYYLFDVRSMNARYLLSGKPWLDPDQLASMQPISFEASDGIRIHGYLTEPVNGSTKPHPMVVIVHGGPHGVRSTWGFNSEAQILAAHGYAVLNVNYRGSGGYGREFEELGYKKWGTRIQDDIADGVRWAINKGVADPERLCVYGGSFGGYSVLSQLVREPDLYQCGFSYVGLYDLNLFMRSGDIQRRESGRNYLERVLPDTEKERHEQSPMQFVDRIKAGLFVAHGDEDVRAHAKHYYELIDALEAADIPHETLVKYREGHGFYSHENKMQLYSELVDFIDEHIGER